MEMTYEKFVKKWTPYNHLVTWMCLITVVCTSVNLTCLTCVLLETMYAQTQINVHLLYCNAMMTKYNLLRNIAWIKICKFFFFKWEGWNYSDSFLMNMWTWWLLVNMVTSGEHDFWWTCEHCDFWRTRWLPVNMSTWWLLVNMWTRWFLVNMQSHALTHSAVTNCRVREQSLRNLQTVVREQSLRNLQTVVREQSLRNLRTVESENRASEICGL